MKKLSAVLLLVAAALFQSCASAPATQKVVAPSGEKSLAQPAQAPLSLADRYTIGGFPVSKSRPTVTLENIGYAVGFSEELKDPLWAAYYCGKDAAFISGKRPAKFSTDTRVAPAAQLVQADYNRPVGETPTYDRGHMAPNFAIATRYGRAAQLESFLLTNVVPQRSSLNQKTWRALEAEIPYNYASHLDGVWVIVGPIFEGPITRYNGKAAMPSAFFCIIIDRTEAGKLRALALTMDQSLPYLPNNPPKIGKFITTIRDIEKRTGLDFCSALPDDIEDALETHEADTGWDRALVLKINKYGNDE
jgi:endonuclease G